MTLREELQKADEAGVAIGHFNISTLDMFHAVVHVGAELDVPVIIGVSEGERDYIGIPELLTLIAHRRSLGQRVYVNADHTYSVERVKEAIDAGFDAVIFDAAKEPFEVNSARTRECVDYARASSSDVLVEGEVGYIGTSSKVLEAIPDGVADEKLLTTREQAMQYVDETGVDLFAPAVGNLHGMLSTGRNPRLFIDRIQEIHDAINSGLVLHGGSGISDEDFVHAIDAGMRIIHISTELRVAYKQAFSEYLKNHPEDVAPYKYFAPGKEAVERVVRDRLQLFNKLPRTAP